MEKFQDWFNGRVTTDAVHRRFRSKKKNESKNSELRDSNAESECFYCAQCKININASHGKEELKSHFRTIEHNPYSSCVYCSKPVYVYRYNQKLEVYHTCSQDY